MKKLLQKILITLLLSLVFIAGTKAQDVHATIALSGGNETAIALSANAEWMVVASDGFNGGSEIKVEKFHLNTTTKKYDKLTAESYSLYEGTTGSGGAVLVGENRTISISNSGNIYIYYRKDIISGTSLLELNKDGNSILTFSAWGAQSMQIIDDYLYIMLESVSSGYRFYKIDESTDQVVWMRTDVPSGYKILPIVRDGKIFVKYNDNGELKMYNDSDGAFVQTVKTGVPEGNVYYIDPTSEDLFVVRQGNNSTRRCIRFDGISNDTISKTTFMLPMWQLPPYKMKVVGDELKMICSDETLVLQENNLKHKFTFFGQKDGVLPSSNYFHLQYAELTDTGKVEVWKWEGYDDVTVHGLTLSPDDRMILNHIENENLSLRATLDASADANIYEVRDFQKWDGTNWISDPHSSTIIWENGHLPNVGETLDNNLAFIAPDMERLGFTPIKICDLVDESSDLCFTIVDHKLGYLAGYNNVMVFNIEQSTVGINEFDLAKTIKIYPNPTQETVKIQAETEITQIKILDIQGKELKRIQNKNEINVKQLPKGVYLIKIQTNGKSIIKRFVKV